MGTRGERIRTLDDSTHPTKPRSRRTLANALDDRRQARSRRIVAGVRSVCVAARTLRTNQRTAIDLPQRNPDGVQFHLPESMSTDSRELIRRLSADLQRTSNALDTLINAIPIGIGLAEDAECRDIRVNRAFAEQLGIDPDENASLSASENRPAFKVFLEGRELPPEELAMQLAARTAREVGPLTCDIVHPDGRKLTLYEYAAPLFDEERKVRGAIGVFVDITERQRVEQEQQFLARAGEILSSSLDYRATLAALARLVVPMLGDYCALDMVEDDETFNRVEFVVADEQLQDVANGLKQYPPLLTIDSPATRTIRSGEPTLETECPPELLDRSAQTPDHRELLARLGVKAFIMVPLTVRGRTLGLFTVGSVTPSRRYSERDLKFMLEVGRRAALAIDNARLYRLAQEANRVKDEFLATLSHELRTPLNALLGWTQLLKRRSTDEEFRQRALESIERSAHAQAVLIDDLLDVSRVIHGKLTLVAAPVDLEAIIAAAVDAIRPLANARNIELTASLAPLARSVLGDADRLQQVFGNLLSNAIKFTPTRGRIELTLEEYDRDVRISVSDNGAGIDPGFLPHVFERFRQADSTAARSQGGLGLGLSIVRHLVELHGGSVTVASDGPDKGTRVVIVLPTQIAEEASDVRHAPDIPAQAAESGG